MAQLPVRSHISVRRRGGPAGARLGPGCRGDAEHRGGVARGRPAPQPCALCHASMGACRELGSQLVQSHPVCMPLMPACMRFILPVHRLYAPDKVPGIHEAQVSLILACCDVCLSGPSALPQCDCVTRVNIR